MTREDRIKKAQAAVNKKQEEIKAADAELTQLKLAARDAIVSSDDPKPEPKPKPKAKPAPHAED